MNTNIKELIARFERVIEESQKPGSTHNEMCTAVSNLSSCISTINYEINSNQYPSTIVTNVLIPTRIKLLLAEESAFHNLSNFLFGKKVSTPILPISEVLEISGDKSQVATIETAFSTTKEDVITIDIWDNTKNNPFFLDKRLEVDEYPEYPEFGNLWKFFLQEDVLKRFHSTKLYIVRNPTIYHDNLTGISVDEFCNNYTVKHYHCSLDTTGKFHDGSVYTHSTDINWWKAPFFKINDVNLSISTPFLYQAHITTAMIEVSRR